MLQKFVSVFFCSALFMSGLSATAIEPVNMQSTSLQSSQRDAITIEEIVGGHYSARRIYGVRPSAEGDTFTQMSADNSRIERRSFKTGDVESVLFDAAKARGPVKLSRIDNYILSPDGRRILLQTQTQPIYRRSFSAVYYIYDIVNKTFTPLSEGGAQQVPLFSPDGSMVAFVRDNNLFLVKLFFDNAECQVTDDGRFNHVINGIPDWVYEEEFTTNRSFDFSADSKMLAWIRYDESRVPIYPIQMFKGAAPTHNENDLYPGDYSYKYPVAGADNSEVKVMSYDIKSHVVKTMDVPLKDDDYVPRIHFTSDPTRLAVVTLNRHQDCMDIYMVNPRSTVARLVLREEAKCYVKESAYDKLRFEGNHFIMASGRSGYQHFCLYNLNGQLLRPLTKGNYDVTDFYGYDAKTGDSYYQAAAESPLEREIYRSDKKGRVTKLTSKEGTNAATFSSDFRYFMNVYSSATVPPITTLMSSRGKTLKTLMENKKLEAEVAQKGGKKEFFSFKTPQGVELNGWMIKPRHFDPSKRYPVLMYQYSGPGSQEVRNSWSMGFYGGGIWESYLAEHGYIVACVDGRGTGARGEKFEKCTYLHLGKLESEDQVETALYLGSLPYVDKDRIGIWGWSFGGFNTLMSMADGRGVFKVGVAVAAPSNWKYYDTVYTERYMRTPKENPYYEDCPIQRAPKFKGKLLLVHGTADDNVHYRNCTEYAEAMVQANKQFDMQIYTNRNHGIFGGNTRNHLFHRISNFIINNL